MTTTTVGAIMIVIMIRAFQLLSHRTQMLLIHFAIAICQLPITFSIIVTHFSMSRRADFVIVIVVVER